jgi:hypothetical protein
MELGPTSAADIENGPVKERTSIGKTKGLFIRGQISLLSAECKKGAQNLSPLPVLKMVV